MTQYLQTTLSVMKSYTFRNEFTPFVMSQLVLGD